MKNRTLRACMLLFISTLWLSCTEEPVVKEEMNVEKVTYENINAREDAHLMNILQGFNPSGSSNGRTQSFDFGEVKLSEAIKVENPYKDIVRYSLILSTDPEDPGFENVVLRDHKGDIYPYITRYEPDKGWLMEKGGEFETRTFTGTLKVLDINRTLLVEVAFNNGRGIETGNYIKKHGRTECDDDGGGPTGGGGGGSGSGTGGNTGGGTSGDYGGGTGGSTGGGSTGGGSTGSGSTDGGTGGGGSDCEWGTTSTTGGLFIDCSAVGMGLHFFRTACDGGDFGDINLCDDPEFAATYSDACEEDPIGVLPDKKLIAMIEFWESSKIDDSELDTCVADIITDLTEINTSLGFLLHAITGKTPPFNWKVKTGPSSGTAQTATAYDRSTKTVTTAFDVTKFGSSSDISIARTILHESLHAWLVYWYREIHSVGITEDEDYSPSYPELLTLFSETNDLQVSHHEFIADKFIGAITSSLYQYAISKGHNVEFGYIAALAWGGLQETDIFKNNFSLSQEIDISNIINIELNGLDNDGNYKPQKGASANCPE
ncbi:hypothetical protein JMN32_14805 [Fulvivirga sp. 29W222]|uniref:Uncharacterized protein n=1 Tax=Fulvivirga marina TaxID=2494733 RepID=A0A937KBZ3_9BACT|nr:hypothetical protein [Fulvivirga marina]MBL6447586.1 hypothetical protein [Fulvivirga marina]